jgi:hypothetical protein
MGRVIDKQLLIIFIVVFTIYLISVPLTIGVAMGGGSDARFIRHYIAPYIIFLVKFPLWYANDFTFKINITSNTPLLILVIFQIINGITFGLIINYIYNKFSNIIKNDNDKN